MRALPLSDLARIERQKFEWSVEPYYSPHTTLRYDIDALCSPSHEPLKQLEEERLLANVLLKYFAAYASNQPADARWSLDTLDDLWQSACFPFDGAHNFPLDMLADFPKTMKLMHALISSPLNYRTHERGVAIDAGAGTGILLVGHHILLRRHGLERRVEAMGVEVKKEPASRSHRLLQELGIGSVICDNAVFTDTYRSHRTKQPVIFSSETIPTQQNPLSYEPFLDILLAFQKAFCDAPLSHTRYLPHGLHLYGKHNLYHLSLFPPIDLVTLKNIHPAPPLHNSSLAALPLPLVHKDSTRLPFDALITAANLKRLKELYPLALHFEGLKSPPMHLSSIGKEYECYFNFPHPRRW